MAQNNEKKVLAQGENWTIFKNEGQVRVLALEEGVKNPQYIELLPVPLFDSGVNATGKVID